jgi:hypothetical protein
MSQALRRVSRLDSRQLALFAMLLACYAYFFPRWADWNQNSRFDLVVAVVDSHTLSIDQYASNTGDYATVAGHIYSDKAPGTALLGVPVYAALRGLVPVGVIDRLVSAANQRSSLNATLRPDGEALTANRISFFLGLTLASFLVSAVPSALLGVILYWTARALGLRTGISFAGALLYGLATSAFPYANTFVGHQTSAFLLFSSFAILFAIRLDKLSANWLVLVGFLLAYAAINEYQTALIGALLLAFAFLALGRPLQTAVRLAAGGWLPLVLLLLYDLASFGTPLPVGYFHSTLWSDVHSVGFVSLTYPHLDAIWGITFGDYRGLFFLSPYLLLAVPGYFALWRDRERRLEFGVLILAPLAFLLFNGSSEMWSGGFAVGPRYLVPSLPFLALAATVGLENVWSKPRFRIPILLAATWSIAAVWAETIGGQAFPDYSLHPLFSYSLVRLQHVDIARNMGMVLGLTGWASLVPLAVFLVACSASLGLPLFRPSAPVSRVVTEQRSVRWT